MKNKLNSSYFTNVSVKSLFDTGAHLGHKVSSWNPKMLPYIYGTKNKTYIIDLKKTYGLLIRALNFLFKCAKNNNKILFVGTRLDVRQMVSEAAQNCSQHYVNYRWLGGMITNWKVISKSIESLYDLEKLMLSEKFSHSYTKKEKLSFEKDRQKLVLNFGGIKKMRRTPDVIIVLDAQKDQTAILEANKMNIPVIAILDTNSNPNGVLYPIPSNDDAAKCIKLYLDLFGSCINSASQSADKSKNFPT